MEINMIGMNRLGTRGRLGNQMFQYASLVGIAKNMGYGHCIPDHSKATWFDRSENGNTVTVYHQLQHLFKLEHLDGRFGEISGYEIDVHQHEFCEDLFTDCPDNASLNGHFESYKYFENADDEVRKDYSFKDFILDTASNFHKKNNINNSVCINVRRGDFIKFQNCHAVCTENYYFKCIEKLDKDRQYLVVSDDIDWCKTVFLGSNYIFLDVQNNKIPKAHFDMCVGSLCDDFIISNSTFSWWMSYLGKSKTKKVFIPDPWFGPSLQHLDTSGYYFPQSIKVNREVVGV